MAAGWAANHLPRAPPKQSQAGPDQLCKRPQHRQRAAGRSQWLHFSLTHGMWHKHRVCLNRQSVAHPAAYSQQSIR